MYSERDKETEQLLQKELAVNKQLHGNMHPTVVTTMDRLAHLYRIQRDYAEAERLLLRVILMRTRMLGPAHPDTLLSLINLGHVYLAQGRREEAETIYQRALINCEAELGPEHPTTITTLDSLATLYAEWSNVTVREGGDTAIVARSVDALWQRVWEAHHLDNAQVLHKLALIYVRQEKWEQAEISYQRVLLVYEKALGIGHEDTMQCLRELAFVYAQRDHFDEAEVALKRLLKASKQLEGAEPATVAADLNS